MSKTQQIKQHCKQLKLSAVAEHLDPTIAEAQNQELTYLELVKRLFEKEIVHREEKALHRRTKLARLPAGCNLDAYDFAASGALEPRQLSQLRELAWLEQTFNLILMGPSGTGYVNHMIM